MPTVDRYTEISKTAWDAHIANAKGKGKAHIIKMDAILTDSHLDTRIKRCILMNVIVPKLQYVRHIYMGREREVRKTIGIYTDYSS